MSTPASLSHLPPELYAAILEHVPTAELTPTVLALTRALPYSSIPQYYLFQYVHLKRADQVVKLYQRLRRQKKDAQYVVEFSLEAWTLDADVLVNLVALLDRLVRLSLFVGPNFAPEHLVELFERPKLGLKFISLRFRPYVQRATYLQFMKGAYFDPMLEAISRWPASNLPTFSIIQDPFDRALDKERDFAQPLVFFRLDPFSSLVRSHYLQSLSHFRLRIPSRQVARFIYGLPGSVPNLELLDMSTCNVLESDVEAILGKFGKLKHLVVDNCLSLLRGTEVIPGEWHEFGKSLALAGTKRAREREKKLRVWLEAVRTRLLVEAGGGDPDARDQDGAQRQTRGTRRGRRGLATATISLRDSPTMSDLMAPDPVLDVDEQRKVMKLARVRLLPAPPKLVSLSTTARAAEDLEKRELIQREFEAGWAEGLAQLVATKNRIRESMKRGTVVMRISEAWEEEDGVPGEDRLDGLREVSEEEMEGHMAGRSAAGNTGDGPSSGMLGCPVLCLAGPGKEGHVVGCGHAVGWQVWNDEL